VLIDSGLHPVADVMEQILPGEPATSPAHRYVLPMTR